MVGRISDSSWRLRGTARHVASFVAAFFVAAALLVAAIDRAGGPDWGWTLLQDWSLVPHGLAVGGLLYAGRACDSKAFRTLAALIGLIFVEEAFHLLNLFTRFQVRAALHASRWTGIEWDGMSEVVVYGSIAVVGLAFLVYAHRQASQSERRVVRSIALLLLVGGFFGGPISSLAGFEDPHHWMFVEELGEAITYALIAGYVAGLVHVAAMPPRHRRLRLPIRERQ